MNKIGEYIKKYDILIFIVLIFLLYFSTLFYDFIYDDLLLLLQNNYLNGRYHINFIDFFKPNFVMEAIYTPLTFMVQWLIIKLFGSNSFAFHFINIIFYILSSIALFYLLKKIISNYYISFFAVILYILHPCHIENVAWAAAMGYTIASIFFFLSFIYFISAYDEDKKLNYVFSVVFYILAILSQPVAVVLPALLLAWAWCYRKQDFLKIFKLSLFHFLFCVIYLILFKIVFNARFGTITRFLYNADYTDVFHMSFLNRLAVLGKYLFLSFFPFNLVPIYPLPLNIYCILTICFIFFLIYIFFYNKSSNILFFSLWFVISIVPYACIFFYSLPMANRYLLLSSISSCVLLSYLSFFIFEKFKERHLIKYLSFIIFSCIYFLSFFFYVQVWKNEDIFWAYAYKTNPSFTITYNYSLNLINKREFLKALKISEFMIYKHSKNSVFSNNPEFYEVKVKCLMSMNKIDQAIETLNVAIKKVPDFYRWDFYLFDVYFYLTDFDKLNNVFDKIDKLDKKIFLRNDSDLLEQLKMMFYYTNADTVNYIKSFSLMTNNFDKFPTYFRNGIENNTPDLDKLCLKYINEFPNSNQRKNVMILLNSIYINECYKDKAGIKIKYFLKQMFNANKFLLNNDFLKAEEIYRDIIDKDKYMFEAYFKLGEIYIKTNRVNEAKQVYEKLLLITPSDKNVSEFVNYLNE